MDKFLWHGLAIGRVAEHALARLSPLSPQERAARFRAADADSSGVLDGGEAATFARFLGMSEQFGGRFEDALPEDAAVEEVGGADVARFLALRRSGALRLADLQAIARFRALDVDYDGQVDKREYRKAGLAVPWRQLAVSDKVIEQPRQLDATAY